MDLRHLVLSYREPHSGPPGKLGLEALAEKVLGVALDKDWRLRASDWEAMTLKPRQIKYATNDALVAVNILWVVLSRHFQRSLPCTVSSMSWGEKGLQKEVARALEHWLDLDFSDRTAPLGRRSCLYMEGGCTPRGAGGTEAVEEH